MPLYRVDANIATQIKPASFKSERELQRLFEANLEHLLGVSFVASEFTTGDRQRGRIDTLGLDQNGFPTIIEYKKSSKENVINQGLFYLDWLVDHKGDFIVAAQERLGPSVKIEWGSPRLILIAEDFTEYDKYAVNRIGANIELWSYRLYQDGLLFLDPIFVPEASRARPTLVPKSETKTEEAEEIHYDLDWHLAGKPEEIRELMGLLREKILGLGEGTDIVENVTKIYIGYRHGKNFCEVKPLKSLIKLWLDINPSEIDDPRGLGRDVSNIGHRGTGQVEVQLSNPGDLGYVINLIEQAYLLTV
jgi:predicted transport protein